MIFIEEVDIAGFSKVGLLFINEVKYQLSFIEYFLCAKIL